MIKYRRTYKLVVVSHIAGQIEERIYDSTSCVWKVKIGWVGVDFISKYTQSDLFNLSQFNSQPLAFAPVMKSFKRGIGAMLYYKSRKIFVVHDDIETVVWDVTPSPHEWMKRNVKPCGAWNFDMFMCGDYILTVLNRDMEMPLEF